MTLETDTGWRDRQAAQLQQSRGIATSNHLALFRRRVDLLEKLHWPVIYTRSRRGRSRLAHALDAGQLAGAALDVLAQEPPDELAFVWPR